MDAVLDGMDLDALVAPTGSPPWTIDLVNADHFLGASSGPAAMAGYPLISVPAGYAYGLPVGITFMGRAWSEPTLIRIAHAFELAAGVRQPPRYLMPPTGMPPAALAALEAAGLPPSATPVSDVATPQTTPAAMIH